MTFQEFVEGGGPAASFDGETGEFAFLAAETDRPGHVFTFVAIDAQAARDSVQFTVTVP